MLAAELALPRQPAGKRARGQHPQQGRGQGQVAVALGVVVGIEAAQRGVEHGCEAVGVGRWGPGGQLYGPLVAAPVYFAAAPSGEVHRGGREVVNPAAGGLAGGRHGGFGILNYHFLAERVEEVFGASRDAHPVGPQAGEAHSVAHHVAPQPGVGADDQCVGPVQGHFMQRHGARIKGLPLVGGQKFVVDAVVEQQQ